jgi:hypothetical protein
VPENADVKTTRSAGLAAPNVPTRSPMAPGRDLHVTDFGKDGPGGRSQVSETATVCLFEVSRDCVFRRSLVVVNGCGGWVIVSSQA